MRGHLRSSSPTDISRAVSASASLSSSPPQSYIHNYVAFAVSNNHSSCQSCQCRLRSVPFC